MTKSIKVTKDLDDELAEFTDRILSGKASAPISSSDKEMLRLEETVLRLNQSISRQTLDERTTKRLLADFNIRRRSVKQTRPVVWWSWQTRQRFGLALAAVILLVAGILIVPSLPSGNGIPASAGLHPLGVGLPVLLVGVVLLLVVLLVKSRK